MASLFDTLGASAPPTASSLAPPSDSGAQIQKIQDVGTTGTLAAAGAAAPKRSALGEAGVLDEVKAGLHQLDTQQTATLGAQQYQAHQIDLESQIQNKQLDAAVLDTRVKNIAAANQLMGDLERGKKTLATEQGQAQLEQLGANLRLADDKYVFNLQMEGARNRLTNKFAFDEALQASVWGDDYKNAQAAAVDAINLDKTRQERLRAIGDISVDAALQMAGMDAAAYRTAAVAAGVKGTVDAYARYSANAPETTNVQNPNVGANANLGIHTDTYNSTSNVSGGYGAGGYTPSSNLSVGGGTYTPSYVPPPGYNVTPTPSIITDNPSGKAW